MASHAPFSWSDPFLLDEQLTDDERQVRDAAHAYCQERLLPRVQDAFRYEKTDRAIFKEMGELGLLGPTIPEQYGGAGLNYVCYGLVAREVERRAPTLATSRWWKEERQGVLVDFNQNAKDRTVASAWSVRATPDARVSLPLRWEEVGAVRPEDWTLTTAPERYAAGDPWAGMAAERGSLDGLLALAQELGPVEKPPKGTGGRTVTMPLVEIARARTKAEALAGLESWKAKHPDVVPMLEESDVLVDGMRGSSSLWYRIRVNLQHVPEAQRPEQAELEVDYDPWKGYRGAQRPPARR